MVSTTKTITNTDKTTVKKILGPDNKVLASAAARLYFSEKGSKQWKRLKEAAAFNLNCQEDILYFSLVDLECKNLEWSQEIYLDLKYYRDSENFYSFEGDKGMIGILFANSQEAQEFYEVVCDSLEGYTKEERMSRNKVKSSKSTIFGVFGFGRKSKSSESTERIETLEIKPKLEEPKKKKKSKDSELSHDDVSEPRDFTHLSHIGFNPEKGTFDIQNIPSDWKTLFAKAGITQDQLQNRSTAKFIAGFVQDSEPQMKEMMQKKKKPPVPVPMKKKNAPPPPPPPTKTKKQPLNSPLKSTNLPPPPPPPPKKSNNSSIRKTSVSAPPPPPPPLPVPDVASTPQPAIAPSVHSALLESIRGAGTSVLKPVKENSVPKSSASTAPSCADPHSVLMASIKNGASLKPASKASPSSPTSSVSSTDPTDMMAAMLAKALAARNKKLAADSSDEDENDSDDSRW